MIKIVQMQIKRERYDIGPVKVFRKHSKCHSNFHHIHIWHRHQLNSLHCSKYVDFIIQLPCVKSTSREQTKHVNNLILIMHHIQKTTKELLAEV